MLTPVLSMLRRSVSTWFQVRMAAIASSPGGERGRMAATLLSSRLKKCWSMNVNWDLYPSFLKEGCAQAAKAIGMPSSTVLFGFLVIVSFAMSHSVVEVEGTDWIEPVLLWVSICMPTGSGKSSLCKFLKGLVSEVHSQIAKGTPKWFLDDQSFAKMGALMEDNNNKILALYDELSMFLSQTNVLSGKKVTDSHELSVFLQLYGAYSWARKTVKCGKQGMVSSPLLVSGEANFEMETTGLRVGGFIQPSVARNILDQTANAEKGLCQRFLWFVPQPTPVPFDDLTKVNRQFSASIVGLMSTLWRNNKGVKIWKVQKPCPIFRERYDAIQEQLQTISCMDDLLSGMLSKSKGQILQLSACLHVLFHTRTPAVIPDVISADAIKAAIDIVDVCIQHAAFLAGRGDVNDTIEEMAKESVQAATPENTTEAHRNAAVSLLLPGKVLHLNALLLMRKFRDRGNKPGAVHGFEALEEGLGTLIATKLQRGANLLYKFEKANSPEDGEERATFAESLLKFGVSLLQYEKAIRMEDITLETVESRKRPSTALYPAPRRSPRKSTQDD